MSELGLPNLGFLDDHPCYYNIQLDTDTTVRRVGNMLGGRSSAEHIAEEFDKLKIEW